MAKVVILGAGVMGSAMSLPLASNHHRISLVGTHLDDDIIRSVQGNGYHPNLKTTLPDRVSGYYHQQLAEVVTDDTELIILGVNSLGVVWAAQKLGELDRPLPPILMITKGLSVETGELEVFPHSVRRHLQAYGRDDTPIAAVAGPCIAGELAACRHSAVIYTHTDQTLLDRLAGMLSAPYYHIRSDTDVIGIEICAALKNLYALGIGCATGFLETTGVASNGAQMHNPAANLFGQAILEMKYFAAVLGGDPATVDGNPGAGDLYVTCQGGRNSRMGKLLGQGMKYSIAKKERMPNDSVEGAELALAIGPTVEALCNAGKFDSARLPLMRAVINAIGNDDAIRFDWSAFHRTF